LTFLGFEFALYVALIAARIIGADQNTNHINNEEEPILSFLIKRTSPSVLLIDRP
jgi:hypothetical protein